MKLSVVAGVLFFAVMIPLSFSFASPHVDRVVAVVNGDVITLSELNRSLDPILKRIQDDPRARDDQNIREELRSHILDRMIGELLMEQEARRLNIEVQDDDIDAYIDEMLRRKNMTRRELLENLAEEGTSVEEYREEIRREILKSKVINREIRAKVNVSEEEIGEYYSQHRQLYEGKPAVRIQQIFVEVPRDADSALREEKRNLAEEIRRLVETGESFEDLVRRFSEGPEVRSGGDLGFIERGMLLPSVEEAAFSLDLGQISDVIESPAGFHIIRVIDRRGAGLKPLEEVREDIIIEIRNKRMEERFQAWIEKLKNRAYIEIRL